MEVDTTVQVPAQVYLNIADADLSKLDGQLIEGTPRGGHLQDEGGWHILPDGRGERANTVASVSAGEFEIAACGRYLDYARYPHMPTRADRDRCRSPRDVRGSGSGNVDPVVDDDDRRRLASLVSGDNVVVVVLPRKGDLGEVVGDLFSLLAWGLFAWLVAV